MVKKIFLFALFSLVLLNASPTLAQYHRYSSGKPAVELNMDVLESIEGNIKWDDGVPAPSHVPLPVTQAPLDEPELVISPNSEQKPARVLKPINPPAFTEAPSKTYSPSPVLQNMMNQPAQSSSSVPATSKLEPAQVPTPTPAPVPAVDQAAVTAPIVTEPPKVEPEASKDLLTPVDISDSPTKESPAIPAQETPITDTPGAVPSISDLSLVFDVNENEVTEKHQKQLQSVIAHLNEAPGTRLQIRAYASGDDGSKSSARRISLSRALSIRSFLMDNQIKPTRVDVRALGTETDRPPLDRADLIFVR